MTAVVVVLLALVASLLLSAATAVSASTASVAYFRPSERADWQLDTSAAAVPVSPSSADAASASRAAGHEPVSFLWMFTLQNLDWLKAELDETSNPASARYLQRQPESVVDAKVGPTADEKEAVRAWLLSNGLDASDIDDWRHVLRVRTTAGVVEQLFNTTMHRYRHTSNGRSALVARSGVYVPAALAARLSGLSGVYNFPHPIHQVYSVYKSSARVASGSAARSSTGGRHRRRGNSSHSMHTMQTEETNKQCPIASGNFLPVLRPADLANLYNFPLRNTDTSAQPTSAAVAGGFQDQDSNGNTENQAYSQADLSHFKTNIGFSASFTANNYGNSNNADNLASNPSGATEEASLDIEAVRAAATHHIPHHTCCAHRHALPHTAIHTHCHTHTPPSARLLTAVPRSVCARSLAAQLFQISPTSNNGFYAVTGQDGLFQSLSGIYALDASVRPQVVSYSYSFGASDYNYQFDDGGRTEALLQVLLNAGVTIIASAGDDGTPSSYNTACQTVSSRRTETHSV